MLTKAQIKTLNSLPSDTAVDHRWWQHKSISGGSILALVKKGYIKAWRWKTETREMSLEGEISGKITQVLVPVNGDTVTSCYTFNYVKKVRDHDPKLENDKKISRIKKRILDMRRQIKELESTVDS